jgi:Zn-dependent protease with chaperone function
MQQKFTKLGFVRTQVLPALLLFAIPVAGLYFAKHVQNKWDGQFIAALTDAVEHDAELAPDKRQAIEQFYRDNPPSVLCAGGDETRGMLPPEYVAQACGDQAQIRWIALASLGSIALGVLSLVLVLACVAISFSSRQLQYLTFVAGWNFLRLASALQVLAQGFVAVMLSFWLTAYYFERYSVKLIAIVGIAGLTAAALVIRGIFQKTNNKLEVEGESLEKSDSPELWNRIEGICQKLGTAPPHTILGGIDNNFFVTEHPVHVGDRVFQGRSLFVSLSLLKRMTKPEADAVLAHEMAHFSGDDTSYSKKLSPLLTRYATYLQALYNGALSRPVFYFMLFYWSMFQISLGKRQRQRELRADKQAAEITSPESMGNALLKVAAYSCYRARVENNLFKRQTVHSNLDIAHSVAVGFIDYARGPELDDDLKAEHAIPHPFDSHPSLGERFANVGWTPGGSVADVVVNTEAQSWYNEIGGAERIEGALWDAYEARFAAAHEEALAYRYLPSNDTERAHVERFFPPVTVPAKTDASEQHALHIDCEKVRYDAWPSEIRWHDVTDLSVEDKTFRGKILTVRFSADGKRDKIELPFKHLAENHDVVIALFSRYYARSVAARAAAGVRAAS